MALHTVKLIALTSFAKQFGMTDPSGIPAKSPIGRLAALAILVLVGLGLFYSFAPRTPVVARPADSEPAS
jgi:hypothetical protein